MIHRTTNSRKSLDQEPGRPAERSVEAGVSLDAKAMLASLRMVVRRAWQTLAVMRDPDLHYFRRGGWLFSVVHEMNQAYGYASAQARAFQPTSLDVSRMETVMGWMAWLRRTEGERAIKRLIGWSMGVPLWQMARRENCSERTIANRIDRSLNCVLKAFGDLDARPETIEEPAARPAGPHTHIEERPTGMQAGTLQPGRLWIDGIGWMFKGRPWNDGHALAESLAKP